MSPQLFTSDSASGPNIAKDDHEGADSPICFLDLLLRDHLLQLRAVRFRMMGFPLYSATCLHCDGSGQRQYDEAICMLTAAVAV